MNNFYFLNSVDRNYFRNFTITTKSNFTGNFQSFVIVQITRDFDTSRGRR